MIGVNNRTGKALDGMEHLKQSVQDILTTPLGTRVMRREYGSRLFELIDAPINSSQYCQRHHGSFGKVGATDFGGARADR
jgi:phage baseplate assembly protein W